MENAKWVDMQNAFTSVLKNELEQSPCYSREDGIDLLRRAGEKFAKKINSDCFFFKSPDGEAQYVFIYLGDDDRFGEEKYIYIRAFIDESDRVSYGLFHKAMSPEKAAAFASIFGH